MLGQATGTPQAIANLERLIGRLGSGFYRGELRTLLNAWRGPNAPVHSSRPVPREQRWIPQGHARHAQAEVQADMEQRQAETLPSEPDHAAHRSLCAAALEPARLAAWHTELKLAP